MILSKPWSTRLRKISFEANFSAVRAHFNLLRSFVPFSHSEFPLGFSSLPSKLFFFCSGLLVCIHTFLKLSHRVWFAWFSDFYPIDHRHHQFPFVIHLNRPNQLPSTLASCKNVVFQRLCKRWQRPSSHRSSSQRRSRFNAWNRLRDSWRGYEWTLRDPKQWRSLIELLDQVCCIPF